MATTYRIQIATDKNFSNIIVDESGLTSTNFSPVGLTNHTRYFWRIKAQDENGISKWSSPYESITISESATSYRIQIAADNNFTNIVVDQNLITENNYTPTGLTGGEEYFWRVSATNSKAESYFTQPFDFFFGVPTCWSYRARYKNSSKLFSLGGHEKFPSKLKVPGNVDRSSGIMTDEGKFIDPGLYTVE